MSKLALITRADSNIKEMTDITFPVIQEYADKIGAEFINLDHDAPFLTDDNKPHYRILKVIDLFDSFDRIAHVDADVLISKKCPNIFEVVGEDSIGTIYEDKGSRVGNRRSLIRHVQSVWGDVGWTEGYTNAGVSVWSKQHKNIFLPHRGQYWTAWGSADIHMAYNAHKYGYKIQELDYKWNHMTMFSEDWNGNANRFDSYVIHYAGRGIFDPDCKDRLSQIKKDYKVLYND
jgi:hypothetical protein